MHTWFLDTPFILYIIIIDIDIMYLYVGLQTKGKFACLVCSPKIKSRRSKILEMRCLMSIDTSSLRITGIELSKKYIQWEARDCIKTAENDTSPMDVAI